MPIFAYACEIKPENFQVIASENPNFDLNEIKWWLDTHNAGFFVRDEGWAFDCEYITPEIFAELYRILDPESTGLFYVVERR